MTTSTSGSSSSDSLTSSTPSSGNTTQSDKENMQEGKEIKEMSSARSTDQPESDKDCDIDVVDGDIKVVSEEPPAMYHTEEEGSDISGIEFDIEVVGQKISLATDDASNVKEPEPYNIENETSVDTEHRDDDLSTKDIKIDIESFKDQRKDTKEQYEDMDTGETEPLNASARESQTSTSVDDASFALSGIQQHLNVSDVESGSQSISEGSSSIEMNMDYTTSADRALVYTDVSRMSNAPDSLLESWKNLIETNLRTLEMLKTQKLESEEIHDSCCKEFESLRGDVIRLYEDNGRKRYLVDEIRLKYPGMFDEHDEIRPMNEIMDQHIRNREDKMEMELSMPSIYHQFLQDKTLIERSIGMECIGHPLKVFVDQYNELKFAKSKDENQKLHLTEAFPMPDLMARVDKSKSGKYPVFKILKDGKQFVMTNNGLIRAMQRHNEMIKEEEEEEERKEEEEESIIDEESADSISDTGSESLDDHNDSDSGSDEDSFFKKYDNIMNHVTGSNEDKTELEKENKIERTQGKLKLGAKAITLIVQEKRKETKRDSAYCNDGVSGKVVENEPQQPSTADLESRDRRRTKVEEKLALSKHGDTIKDRVILEDKDGVKVRGGAKSIRIKRVQTPRGMSTKTYAESDYKALPPVFADGKHIRMADMNTALQKNVKSNPKDVDIPDGLQTMEKGKVGDYTDLKRSFPHKIMYMDGKEQSQRGITDLGNTVQGFGDPITAHPIKSSRRMFKRERIAKDPISLNTEGLQNAPMNKKTQKDVMRVDNHNYIRKPHPPTSNISPVPKSLPVISKGSMTTIKTSSALGVQLKGQSPDCYVPDTGSYGRIGSAGRRKKVDMNDCSVLSRLRRKE
ncbi:hypothetical protein FSP39_010618 [Pinctada imbricata]|uniref:Uncharacterized protein n=1 Tax=Pinctada imbricata TaxID=66713 RepID=A0AA88XZP4_PINIB|nr:hypothetical protein FSP39_010618 [Pinctada imbricata]